MQCRDQRHDLERPCSFQILQIGGEMQHAGERVKTYVANHDLNTADLADHAFLFTSVKRVTEQGDCGGTRKMFRTRLPNPAKEVGYDRGAIRGADR